MARLYRRTARKDIYQTIEGKFTTIKPYENIGVRLAISKGQSYYCWHPKGSGWQYSLTRPDLRGSWERELEELADMVESLDEDDQDEKENVTTILEERRDELQENLDHMPEQLQESSVLNERIEALDELIIQLN